MTRINVLAPLLMLLICVSGCNTTEIPTARPTPKANPEIKAKLEAARYEVQLYEDELKAVNEEISAIEARQAKYTGYERVIETTTNQIAKRDKLEEKVVQAKVKVRELETLLNEQ
jgi:hypothetical protein